MSDSVYSAAWTGLRESLEALTASEPGTPENLIAIGKSTVWLDVLLILCPRRSSEDILRTASRKVPTRSA